MRTAEENRKESIDKKPPNLVGTKVKNQKMHSTS